MKLEILQKKDLPEISKFANRNFIYDKFTPALLYEKCFDDPNFKPSLNVVVRDKKKIVGFLIGVFRDYERGKFGWIKLMAVDQNYRRRKIATRMLSHLEKEAKALGATDIKVMDVPLNYYMPGLDPRYTEGVVFLLRSGFERVAENINMVADLSDIDYKTTHLEKKLAKQGIVVKRAEMKDREATLAFIRVPWKLWEYEVSNSFKNNPISVHIAIYKKKVVAFSAYDVNNIGLPWFGPMGTDESMRGKKLGEILLKRCLADQKKQGHKISIIPWAGPISFYLNSVNAKIGRVFWTFKKPLTDSKG